MTTIRLPDGTLVDSTAQADIDAAINRGGVEIDPSVAAVPETSVSGPGFSEDPLGSVTSAGRGFVSTVVPGGESALRSFDALATQLTDSADYSNTAQQAMEEHQTAGNVGTAAGVVYGIPMGFGAVGAGTLGRFGGVLAGNALEAAAYQAIEQGAESYTEDMLENPGITSELMAANALRASLGGAATGGAIGGGLTLGLGALGLGGRSVANLARRVTGASEEAMQVAARDLGRADIGSAARSVSSAPESPISQAVRRARNEGVPNMVSRVNDNALRQVADVLPELERDSFSRWAMRAERLPDDMVEAQRLAMQSAHLGVDRARNALEAAMQDAGVTGVDREAQAVINHLYSEIGPNRPDLNDSYYSLSDGVSSLRRIVADLSPGVRPIVEEAISAARPVIYDAATFGRAASVQDSRNAMLTAARQLQYNMRPGGSGASMETLEQLQRHIDQLETVANGGQKAMSSTVRGEIARVGQVVRNAVDQMRMAQRVAQVSDEAERLTRDPVFNNVIGNMAGKWAARAVGGAVGGVPGAFVADFAYKVARDANAKRNAIWAAQNAYEAFTGKASEALFSMVRKPRPAVAIVEFSPAQYRAAVDSVKASQGIPVNPEVPVGSTRSEAATVPPVRKRAPRPQGDDKTLIDIGLGNLRTQRLGATQRSATQNIADEAAGSVAAADAIRALNNRNALRGTPEQRAQQLVDLPPFLRNI